jgi:hypothetical protein
MLVASGGPVRLEDDTDSSRLDADPRGALALLAAGRRTQ